MNASINKYCVCVFKPDISSSCGPQSSIVTIKNTSMSQTVKLSDMFLHYDEHTHAAVYFD